MTALAPPARPVAVLGSAHPGPALAVTVVTALLAVSTDLEGSYAVVLVLAVLAGQLTIGWGNDLVDTARDRQAGRRDKPLATGAADRRVVVGCLAVAAVACVALSFLAGWRSGLVHLAFGVASGHAYNLGVKATAWSWLPYAVAFGTLPAVVTLAGATPHLPPAWMVATAALLGVGAHVLNALPDLADDEAAGVRGLPHRLGAHRSRLVATGLLLGGSAVAVLGPDGAPQAWSWAALAVTAALSAVTLVGRGAWPFAAAVAVALVDVALLAAMS